MTDKIKQPANGLAMRRLSDIEPGQTATVTSVLGESFVSLRLMEMGVVPGVLVKMVKSAPFGDPIEIHVRGYSLALRRNEAQLIEVQL